MKRDSDEKKNARSPPGNLEAGTRVSSSVRTAGEEYKGGM
jgi:hypothetical protein